MAALHESEDLVAEILHRLPVKSLVRFKCVCKSWRNLITNSESFINKHLHFSRRKNSEEVRPVDREAVEQLITIALKSSGRQIHSRWLQRIPICGPCNGLYCANLELPGGIDFLVLLNLSMRDYKVITTPPVKGKCCPSWAVGLGFDPNTNDYKIVRVLEHLKSATTEARAQVYSLKKDSWRQFDPGFPVKIDAVQSANSSTGVDQVCYMSARLVDSATDRGDPLSKVIVSFDMATEKFAIIRLPAFCYYGGFERRALCQVGIVDGTLTLVTENSGFLMTTTYEIWEMCGSGEIDQLWNKKFEVTLDSYSHLFNSVYKNKIVVRSMQGEYRLILIDAYNVQVVMPQLHTLKVKYVESLVSLSKI